MLVKNWGIWEQKIVLEKKEKVLKSGLEQLYSQGKWPKMDGSRETDQDGRKKIEILLWSKKCFKICEISISIKMKKQMEHSNWSFSLHTHVWSVCVCVCVCMCVCEHPIRIGTYIDVNVF